MMKLTPTLLSVTAVAMLLSITGCTDENYDLSNIDTATRINVKDLVLPVNIDPITMGDVIKPDPSSRIQPVAIGGKEFYALVENGDFSSASIDVPVVTAAPAELNPTRADINIEYPDIASRRRIAPITVKCPIREVGADFNYSAYNIDPAIESLKYVETESFRFAIDMHLSAEGADISEIDMRNMKIRAPKGLICTPSVGSYDKESGIWTINELKSQGGIATVELVATGIDIQLADAPIQPDRSMSFSGEFRIESADAYVTAEFSSMPGNASITLVYNLDEFKITAFSGTINYAFKGIDIPDITLGDIPDFLSGDKSNIELANPQIYLNVNNPVSEYGIHFNSNLKLTAERSGTPTLQFTPTKEIEVTSQYGTGPYNYLLAPDWESRNVPTDPYDYNPNLDFVPFPTLGSILATPSEWSVKGLPQTIGITLENPHIPSQTVDNFRLGSIDGIDGHYSVVAPLALKDGSYIYYSSRRDGWNDDGDLEDMVVTKLELTANAVNNCPVDIQVTIYPLMKDDNGNTVRSGAKIESNVIPGNTSESLRVNLSNGEITRLDGFDIEAVLTGSSKQENLEPSQTLELTDIKAKVSGYYQTDF